MCVFAPPRYEQQTNLLSCLHVLLVGFMSNELIARKTEFTNNTKNTRKSAYKKTDVATSSFGKRKDVCSQIEMAKRLQMSAVVAMAAERHQLMVAENQTKDLHKCLLRHTAKSNKLPRVIHLSQLGRTTPSL